MSRWHLSTWILSGSVLWGLGCAQSSPAQVVPDRTLPAPERSQVTGNPNFQIDGGARRGGNLFHSFQSFSIPTGGSAFFNNAADVQNIFSRVTGGSISNIDGVIRANGTANLFLLNPNGILFGAGAQLNIGGSFVASTANSINFADNFHYSATNPQTTPLLTVSVPIGLQMGTNPGAIVVQGNGYDLSIPVPIFSPLIRGTNSTGLQVPAGRTLALIGGDIELVGSTLTAEQGRIELGSVHDGQVSLGSGFALSYPGLQNFGDIRLSQQALADASDGGVIQVQGNNVSLIDGSLIWIQNQGVRTGGLIRVNAASSLETSGTDPKGTFTGGLYSEAISVGNGADIAVSTQQLIIRDGSLIHAYSFSSGKSGEVTVDASDAVQVIGASPINPVLTSAINSVAFNSADGGAVTVSTRRLSLVNGGSVASTNYGTGEGGEVTVNATESVDLIGRSIRLVGSNVSSNANRDGSGGSITINTSRLTIRDGAAVIAGNFAAGRAGNVTINASESVEVSGGESPDPFLTPSYIFAGAPILPESVRRDYGFPDVPSGDSGNLTINTPQLSVRDGATVGVGNQGTGSAGTLQVNASSIFLARRGTITAATASGEGGNINFNVRDVLLLRNNSSITASAGGTGNGGNITINTSSLVAVKNENSDIRADSVNSRGGNVTINTSGLFGIELRDRNTPLSDITATGASSERSGTVNINVQDVDPTRGLAQLPTEVVDASDAIAQGCRASQGSSFVVTGRGGLPPTPQQALGDDPRWRDWRTPIGVSHQPNASRQEILPSLAKLRSTKSALVEATGWVIEPDGKVILTASAPHITSPNRWGQSVNCDRS